MNHLYLKKSQCSDRWRNIWIAAVYAIIVTLCGGFCLASGSPTPSSSLSPEISGEPDGSTREYPLWPHEKSKLLPDPSMVFGRLSSGFRYILKENKRPENKVSLHLYVGAGSLYETDDQQGLAHYLEHMLFNGSTHFPPGELIRYFQTIGMQFGNDANAHTGFDETVYDIILPGGDEDNLRRGLLVMGDYAMGALLLEEEVERERGVILAEKRSRDSASYRTFEATLKFELPDYLVSRRLPIGVTEVIKKADRAMLKTFYDAWYRPDNAVLIMVGDFDTNLAEKLIRDQFKDFTARSSIPVLHDFGKINHQGIKVFHHYEPEGRGTTVSLEVILHHDPEPDSLALRRKQMVEEISDRILQNRLDALLKQPGAPFTAASVGSGVYLNRIRYAEISADTASGGWEETLRVLEREIRRAEQYGFTEFELWRVKKNVLKILENVVREAPTRNSTQLARNMIRELGKGLVLRSPEQQKDSLGPLIESVTLEEVHKAFRKNWEHDHRLILVAGNTDIKNTLSKAPEKAIEEIYQASVETLVKPPETKAAKSFPYLPNPESAGVIVSREDIEDLGITRIQFENGLRLNIKRTDFKTNEILANLIFGYGKSAEPQHLPGLSLLAEETIGESGLGFMDTDDLERALTGKSTYVDFRITETHFNFFAETVTDEVELLFQLLYAHVVDLGFRDNALTLARERLRKDYLSDSRSIDGMMRIKGQRLLAGGDSRFGIPSFDKIQAIGLADIRDWVGIPLTKAPLELSIVGDVDEKRVIELARNYLGALPKRDRKMERPRSDLPYLPKGAVSRIDVDTKIPKAMVVAAWQTDDFWDIHRTRRLSVLADVFSERLRQRIREKLGASYSPYAFNRSSRAYDGYGVFQAYVNVAPDQTDMVLSEVRAIAGDLAKNGVSADELKRAIDPILNSIKTLRQTNGYWLNSVMTASERNPRQLEWARHFLDDYAAVTPKELAELSVTYLTDKRAFAIILQPDRKTAAD